MISLGGGLPSSEYFPFERIDLKVPTPPRFTEQETKETGMTVSAGKHDFAEGKSLYGQQRRNKTEGQPLTLNRYPHRIQLLPSHGLRATTAIRHRTHRGNALFNV